MTVEIRLSQFITDDLLSEKADVAIGPDDNLLLSGLVDSFGVMRLVKYIESEFDVKVQPGEVTLKNFKTVNAMSTFIASKNAMAKSTST